jgi:hypothetical protein
MLFIALLARFAGSLFVESTFPIPQDFADLAWFVPIAAIAVSAISFFPHLHPESAGAALHRGSPIAQSNLRSCAGQLPDFPVAPVIRRFLAELRVRRSGAVPLL